MSEEPTVALLDKHLDGLMKWERFALHLPGIKHTDIEAIKRTSRDDINDQKMALYIKWLEVYPDATWDDVVSALETAKEISIAKKIKEAFPTNKTAAMSPKQPLTVENEATSSLPTEFTQITQQGEVYNVPESVVDELKDLHETFVPLAMDVKNEIESRVDKGEVMVKSLVRYTEEQRAFPIENHTTPINDSQTFLNAIKPHYNFLNPYLLVVLAIQFLSNSYIAQEAREYRSKITAFNKSTLVRSLVNTLKHYRDHLRPITNNKIVKIRINNCLNKEITIWVVQMLIQTLFPIMHPDEVPWYEVCQGSLVLSFIATDNMLLPFIVSCARKMEFMRLLGIVSVSIGNVYMVVNKNTEPFSLENSLIEATANDNMEAVKFLLEYLKVNPNVKCNDQDVLGNQIEYSDNYWLKILSLYTIIFTELVLDIKKEAELHNMTDDNNNHTAQVINSYYEQLQRQHNFFNTALLLSQSSYLSKDLQQRTEQYCEGIEEMKRISKLSELVNELQEYIPDSQPNESYICVTLALLGEWSSCSMWYVEQLIELVFPSVPLKHFQWFRINHHPEFTADKCCLYVFLVPRNQKQLLIKSFKLNKNLAHSLGIYMIEIDDKKAFKGSNIHLCSFSMYSFEEGLKYAKQYENQHQVIDLLERIIQQPSGGWHLQGINDANKNQSYLLVFDSTPLMIACRDNNEELVQLLLKYNADPNICTAKNITALIYSTHSTKIFQMLINSGADSGIITANSITALHIACTIGNAKIVEIMIKRHPSFINMATTLGCTPLWLASEQGHLLVVKKLLENNADPNIATVYGVTPLLISIQSDHFTIADTLLNAKANPNCKSLFDRDTPLLLAVIKNKLQLVETLLELNADPNVINNDGASPLWIASSMGSLELVEKLLQAKCKADPNLYNTKPNINNIPAHVYTTTTPLHAASFNEHLAIIERLLEGKADPNLCGIEQETPLMGAALNGSVKVIERLLKAQADPNIQRKHDGATALTLACDEGHVPVIDKLLQAKADLNIVSGRGNLTTVLWRACFNESVLVAERLLQEPNIDPNTPDKQNGDTPLLIASEKGYAKIVELLLKACADPNIQNNHGDTPLLLAVTEDHQLVIEKLLQAKANSSISNINGNTPLLMALSMNNFPVYSRLQQAIKEQT